MSIYWSLNESEPNYELKLVSIDYPREKMRPKVENQAKVNMTENSIFDCYFQKIIFGEVADDRPSLTNFENFLISYERKSSVVRQLVKQQYARFIILDIGPLGANLTMAKHTRTICRLFFLIWAQTSAQRWKCRGLFFSCVGTQARLSAKISILWGWRLKGYVLLYFWRITPILKRSKWNAVCP